MTDASILPQMSRPGDLNRDIVDAILREATLAFVVEFSCQDLQPTNSTQRVKIRKCSLPSSRLTSLKLPICYTLKVSPKLPSGGSSCVGMTRSSSATIGLGTKNMARHLIFCVLAFAGAIGTTNADHFHLYHPRPMFMAPVVTYQPAYVVPTAMYAVTQVPVTTVSYATSYYAPLVPTVVYATPVYSPPVYSAPVYSAPVYSAPVYSAPIYSVPVYGGYSGHHVHSRLNVHRNGSYNYHVRVR